MKKLPILMSLVLFIAVGCTSQKKLAYLNNLPETNGEEIFTGDIPDYLIQPRDILSISAKAMTPEGKIQDLLSTPGANYNYNQNQPDAIGFFSGYEVNSEGNIILPVIGPVNVNGITLDKATKSIQGAVDKVFKNTTVECKLLSFKFTVIGEVRTPGAYINYNSFLTILEAIGRAGGISDYGRRDKLVVIRPVAGGTKTYYLNLQDKAILSSEAYFLLPNDVVIVEPQTKKIFNLNLPTFSFILTSVTSAITTTLLLINYFK
jgi:polysaccharide export outer membrane protein